MKKNAPFALLFAFFICLVNLSAYATAPAITSFSPHSGVIGTAVTITGNGFNAIAANNIVFFGATQAPVTSATTTSLTVTVPLGGTWQYVSVTDLTTGLTAYSAQQFDITFPNANIAFNNHQDFSTNLQPYSVKLGDIDKDGKPDVVITNYTSNTIQIFRNTSTNGVSAFAAPTSFAVDSEPENLSIADIDGDGKLDLIVPNYYDSSISVFYNTSAIGNISFAQPVTFTTGGFPGKICTSDIDADGKTDVVVTCRLGFVSVLHNTSIPGNISFALRDTFIAGPNPLDVNVGDMDGDGLPDLAVAIDTNKFIILRNTSTAGSISFAAPNTFIINNSSWQTITTRLVDFDGDGKMDLIVGDGNGFDELHYIWQNTSTIGNISFTNVPIQLNVSNAFLEVGDVNGDSKPDLIMSFGSANDSVYVLGNTSVIGAISFSPVVRFKAGPVPSNLAIGDINGDSLTDIVVANFHNNTFSVLLHSKGPQGNLSADGPYCVNGPVGQLIWTATEGSGPYTIVYNDNVSNRTVVNITSGIPFIVFTEPLTSTTYKLVSVTDATGAIRTNNFNLDSATIIIMPQITINSFTPDTGPIGTTVSIKGIGFNYIAANNIVFFGATQASVISATDTSLMVTVPIGATYQYITVTNVTTSATANSVKQFCISISGNIGFSSAQNFPSQRFPEDIKTLDVDNDGKADVIIGHGGYDSVSILHNTSTPGNVSFASLINFYTGTSQPDYLAFADMDGDGKPDIIADGGGLSILRNISSTGNVAFTNVYTSALGDNVSSPVAIGDFDMDGKPDFAGIISNNFILIEHNISTPGHIQISGNSLQLTAKDICDFGVADMDGDGKPDLIALSCQDSVFYIYRNISSCENIAFDIPDTIKTNFRISHPYILDVDGDGKLDIIYKKGYDKLLVYLNTSVQGHITVNSLPDIAVTSFLDNLNFTDINGDGKPDILAISSSSNNILILSNTSTPGNPHFIMIDTIPAIHGNSGSFILDDIDGDTKPDLLGYDAALDVVSVLRFALPPLPQGSLTTNGPLCVSDTGKLTFTASAGTGPFTVIYNDGVANRTNVNVISGVPFNTFTNPVINTTTYSLISVTDANDSTRTTAFTSDTAKIIVDTAINISISIALTSGNSIICAGTPVTFTATVQNGGTSPTYSWLRNGLIQTDTTAVYTSSTLTNNDSIWNVVTGHLFCTVPNTATSNKINISVNTYPIITLFDTSVCTGSTITLYATASSGILSWQDGFINAQTITINNDALFVAIANNMGCITSDTENVRAVSTSAILNNINTTICIDDTVTLSASNAAAYNWQGSVSGNISTDSITWFTPSKTQEIFVQMIIPGCTVTDSFTITVLPERVWPGDANEDLTVNNYDILAIGLAYGYSGPTRANASLTWERQCTQAWVDSFSNSINYAFADCNGDGTINYLDTNAVSLNYSLVHTRGNNERSGNIPLLVHTTASVYQPGDTVSGQLFLGNSATRVSAYGIAFSFDAGPYAKEGTIQITQSSSWLLANGNGLTFSRGINGATVDVAQTRSDHINNTGYGAIADFSFIVDSTANTIDIGTITTTAALCINNMGDIIGLNNIADTITTLATNIGNIQSNLNFDIFPNPTLGNITIKLGAKFSSIPTAEVYNPLGQVILSQALTSNTNLIDLSSFASGFYMIKIFSGNTLLQVTKIFR